MSWYINGVSLTSTVITVSSVRATPTPKRTPRPTATPRPVRKGDTVYFGHYEQDGNTSNGKEAIRWRVLDVRQGKALLISEYGLDAQRYHERLDEITWDNCTLRKWLNNTFLKTAFNSTEQNEIQLTEVNNSRAQGYFSTYGGMNDYDYAFLLSYKEMTQYLGGDFDSTYTARKIKPTAYARSRGAGTLEEGTGWWWLRSPGDDLGYAMCVHPEGFCDCIDVNIGYALVRPAIWVNTGSVALY